MRVLVIVPEMGFGRRLTEISAWLDANIGREDFAIHGFDRSPVGDRMALYFRDTRAADGLLSAFPDLKLADGTTLSAYHSPALPFGRH